MEGDVSVYINMGIILKNNGNYPEALNAYRMADSITAAQNKGPIFEMTIADNRAILYGAMGRLQESEILAKHVLENVRKLGHVGLQIDIVGHLKKLYHSQGRYQESLEYADSLAEIKERILNDEKTRQLAELEARFDASARDEQIIVQQAALRKGRQQNLQLWAGIALLFTVGCATYVGLRRSRRLNRKISSQQQQLVQQKNELEHINEMKDRLFSLIGHDVRVPLNSLMAYATLLDHQDDLPPEKIKRYNTDLREALGATTVLMENLLQFAKAQIRSPQPYPEIIQLSLVMDRTLKLLQPAIAQKKILLQIDFQEETTVFADEDMTEVILRNLVSNAIKFSNTGGTIFISIKPLDDINSSCTIQDTGTGMKPELIALWNDASVPVLVRSRMGTQYEKGAGLGLMLSKTFTTIMDGSLSVKSKEGEGSVFSLLLPRKKQFSCV
ncbi:ATPase/histidine kinase/DNA gyrase B/HSP90 domain protein [Ostertagia ostertagi]